MSRQGNPFIRPCPRDTSCRFAESRLSGCGRSRHSFRAISPAAPDLVRRLAAARKYRWRITMPESCPCARHFGKKARGWFTGTAMTVITRR
jgi:hypothetical protein